MQYLHNAKQSEWEKKKERKKKHTGTQNFGIYKYSIWYSTNKAMHYSHKCKVYLKISWLMWILS